MSKSALHTDLKEDIRAFLEFIGEHAANLNHEALYSGVLLDGGIETKLAKEVGEAINNPLKFQVDALNSIELSLNEMILNSIKAFLNSPDIKPLIKKASQSYPTRVLHFCIVLETDTMENRFKVNEFVRRFEKSSLGSRFPVTFQFLPEELYANLKHKDGVII